LLSDCVFLNFPGFEKFSFQLVWVFFPPRFTRACLCACVCVWVRFFAWAHRRVRACIHMRREMSDLGPIIFFLTRLFFNQFSFKVGPKHPNYSHESAPQSQTQPWHFTNNRINFPSPDNSLACILYPPSTPHFTSAAHLPHPLPTRALLWGVHCQRTGRRLVGCTLRFCLQTV